MVFVWVVLYGLTHTAGSIFTNDTDTPSIFSVLFLLLYAILFIAWIQRAGLVRSLGLQWPRHLSLKTWITLAPLLVFPLRNVCDPYYANPEGSLVFFMFFAAVIEEIFFRGFLLQFLSRKGILKGIAFSALIFSLFHFTDASGAIFSSHEILQVLCAFSAGVCYGSLAVCFHSLWPGILFHFLTNITGVGQSVQPETIVLANMDWWLCIAVYMVFSIRLLQKRPFMNRF